MIKIIDLTVPLTYDLKFLKDIVAKRLGIEHSRISCIQISKRAVDTRNKQDIHFKITVIVGVSGDENEVISRNRNKNKRVSKEETLVYTVPEGKRLKQRPIVVGCGPAGMFAALILAEAGAKPILLERGLDVDSRRRKVLSFWRNGILDTQSNVQFGEGGAGTFSDGKLKIGNKDFRKIKVLTELIAAGAPSEIMVLSKPHIGTDHLNQTVKGIRQKIISLGGEIHFNATLSEILFQDGRVRGVQFIEKDKDTELSTDHVVLAIGHSAHDTVKNLRRRGVYIEQKPFAIGVRIEHTQEMIDRIQYGDFAGHPALGAADYRMVVHLPNGRGVYTFCMCPGGTVVAATSEKNGLTTNGMSEFARDGRNANSALLVTIENKDLGSDDPLAGIDYQRRIEAAAFVAGGGGYKAPVQRLEDFLQRRNSKTFGDVLPTYQPGTEFAQVDTYLPDTLTNSLRQGIVEMGMWMPGFAYPDALLTGVETRSSSPVRIKREDSFQAIGIKGLYPCGEGAGYAGGIISAAVDGVRCAEQILSCDGS